MDEEDARDACRLRLRRLMTCLHAKAEDICLHGGHGVAWCPECGAQRQIQFVAKKAGGSGVMHRGRWRVPLHVRGKAADA